ncbi:MAG: hypothetical protein ACP5D2_00485 [Candidatus Nanoarchaeia archaeon]
MAKKTSKKKKKGKLIKTKEDKQLAWILVILILIIAGFVISWFYIQSLKTFSYAGLEWQIEERPGGEFDWHHTQFPTFYNPSKLFTLSLRNDPRKNNVPVNVDNWEFTRNATIISLGEEARACDKLYISNQVLTIFLSKAIGISTQGAISDKEIAEEQNISFANCTSTNKTVILIQTSEQPSIEQEDNCYKLNIGDCKNFETTERFITAILEEIFMEA